LNIARRHGLNGEGGGSWLVLEVTIVVPSDALRQAWELDDADKAERLLRGSAIFHTGKCGQGSAPAR